VSHLSTDVVVIGAGGAGMYAAVSAARAGARVVLVDKSLIGRGGATIMAQMTVAAALGHQEPDHWTHHLADTIEAGRGLCNEELAAILCREAPERICEMDEWKVGWAQSGGRFSQVVAPGHNIARCCYVDFLNTGPAVAKTLRTRVARSAAITRISGIAVTEIVVRDNAAAGIKGLNMDTGAPVTIAAGAVVLAAGGLTGIYRRNSASANMGGDAYALALRAGAELIDMEFVQFFPIGHLAPRLVGMDPIMWDPFRYKLGGRLLNGDLEEFIDRYGASDFGKYTAMRDVTSFAIIKEVAAKRGSPHGGAWLSFEHVPEDDLRRAFGPVIDRLAANDIDLTRAPIEVSPIAHYHMGGIRVDRAMATCVAGLFAAGEAVGGANGANRLSGNAIPEAFVFGERAGRFAAKHAAELSAGLSASSAPAWNGVGDRDDGGTAAGTGGKVPDAGAGALFRELQELMWDHVGLLRNGEDLTRALARIGEMRAVDHPALTLPDDERFNLARLDWLDLGASLLCAEAVTLAALRRTETRGAHMREDLPETDPAFERNQTISLTGGGLVSGFVPVVRHDYVVADTQASP
jgi:succinate dehydrogenase/fumarate reductase flavoprotein subunit